jgi:hypothetical protein
MHGFDAVKDICNCLLNYSFSILCVFSFLARNVLYVLSSCLRYRGCRKRFHSPRCMCVCVFVCVCLCVYACMCVCLSVCLPACLSVCLPACLLVCLPVCLLACLSVCLSLSVFLSVCVESNAYNDASNRRPT